MSDRILIEVDGVDHPGLVAEIEETVRSSFREHLVPGSWHVIIRPSQVYGRWDVRLYGVDVRHTLSIAVPAQFLPTLIPLRVWESLEGVCTQRPHEPTETSVDKSA